MLMFLIEKLPRDNTQSSDEPMGTGVMLSRTIAAELALCLGSPWTPGFCKKDSTAWSEGKFWLEVSVYEWLCAFTRVCAWRCVCVCAWRCVSMCPD